MTDQVTTTEADDPDDRHRDKPAARARELTPGNGVLGQVFDFIEKMSGSPNPEQQQIARILTEAAASAVEHTTKAGADAIANTGKVARGAFRMIRLVGVAVLLIAVGATSAVAYLGPKNGSLATAGAVVLFVLGVAGRKAARHLGQLRTWLGKRNNKPVEVTPLDKPSPLLDPKPTDKT